MTVKQTNNAKWLVEIDRKGIPRTRKTFSVKSEAEAYEREYLTKHQPKPTSSSDTRTLKELIMLWYKYHGINLSNSDRVLSRLLAMSHALGNPYACQLTAEAFVEYRFDRLQAGISEKTINNHHGYLASVFNKLRKLKVIDYDNPLAEVDFIKIHERQLSYLSVEQIQRLLEAIKSGCINQSTWYVAQICLRTGARWGEAEQLCFKQLYNSRVTFEFTKSKRTRTVPLDPAFYKELLGFAGFKNPDERIFTNCIGAFRRSVARSGIELQKGQNTHILRHSFASHFIMNGGNILTLQNILGHADITMTMRYAHLAPDHLFDAVKFNPVA